MPNWKTYIRRKLRRRHLDPDRETEIVEELAQHLEDQYRDLLACGETESEARRIVLSELTDGPVNSAAKAQGASSDSTTAGARARPVRRLSKSAFPRRGLALGTRRRNMLADFRQDLRYGFRSLIKHPGFSFIAIITVALGIGANTAIFSVVNGVLLRPLPFGNPDRLALVCSTRSMDQEDRSPFCPADYFDWKAQNQAFESLAVYTTNRFNYTGGEAPEQIQGAWVTADFFDTLGVQPILGRTFVQGEDQPGASPTVVISDRFWRRHLGANPDVLEQQITLNGRSFSIIGVMPSGFVFPEKDIELWPALPLATPTRRGPYYLFGVARLASASSQDSARAEMETIGERVKEQTGSADGDVRWISMPLTEAVVGRVRPALMVLLLGVLFVLLIASVNVANLLLARATAREREMSLRLALGASRSRLIRQLLTESLLLAGLGGLAALPLAIWGIDILLAMSPASLPRLDEIRVDGRVLAFTLIASAFSGLMFGLAPALHGSAANLSEPLKEGSRGTSEGFGRRRMRNALVVFEIALSVVLLVGAGLMIKSFIKLQNVSPGFKPDSILTMNLVLPHVRYDTDEKITAYYDRLIETVQSMPGVSAAGLSLSVPPNNLEISDSFSIETAPWPPGTSQPIVPVVFISPGYFASLGVPITAGRGFNEADRANSPGVVIISQLLADRYFGDENPVGKRFRVGGPERPKNPWMEIVGVAGDLKYSGLSATPEPAYYLPLAQNAWLSSYLVVRTTGNPLRLLPELREQIWSVDRDIPLAKVATMDQLMSESVAEDRFRSLLLGIFAGVALLLASVGVYGVISYSVIQRTHEIGIRLALGARASSVVSLVLKHGAVLAGAGLAIGLVGAFALTRLMEEMLFEVSTTDQAIFVGVTALLGFVAVAACYIPARRASRVDPVDALRWE